MKSSPRPRRPVWARFRPWLERLESRLTPATFFVTKVNDAGIGSLRQAILDANAMPGQDLIHFNIALSGVQTISVTSTLPEVTDPVIIDGTTEGGYAGTPLIVIDGTNAPDGSDGLVISAGASTVKALAIGNFRVQLPGPIGGIGLLLKTGGGNTITGNYLGTDAAGTLSQSNFVGLEIDGSSANQIGGTAAGAGNLISGNGVSNATGMRISGPNASNNIIQGNLIGTDASGKNQLPNFRAVSIEDAIGTIIGGTTASARNVISGNHGMDTSALFLMNSSNSQIQGNYVGVDVTGLQPLGNSFAGILMQGGAGNLIGGTQPGAGNVLSNNGFSAGVVLTSSNNNTVQGNLIGTDAAGMVDFGNGFGGVVIGGGSKGNTIGGTTASARNVISANGANPFVGPGPGVFISGIGTTNNVVQGNFIGTDITGSKALGNALAGVVIFGGAVNNTIGGVAAGAGNVIAGSVGTKEGLFGDGIIIRDTGSNLVQGNRIGTDASGTLPLPNHGSGVLVMSASASTIGGTVAGAGNLLSGNGDAGLHITSLILPPAGLNLDNPVPGGTLAPGTYYYVLTATTAKGETTPSPELTATVKAANPNVPLFWTAVPQATGYKLYRGTAPGQEDVLVTTINSGSTTSFVDHGGPTSPGVPPTINTAAGVDATMNVIQGNRIGTDAGGTAAVPNGAGGVRIEAATSNTIGGTAAGAGNQISGNLVVTSSNYGLSIIGPNASNNVIQGNLIGTDAGGTQSLPNFGGVSIENADGTIVGGTTASARNVISGNAGPDSSGLFEFNSSNTQIQGNYIGVDATGKKPLGNSFAGILIQGGADNLIGGTAPGAGNVLSDNAISAGIVFNGSDNNIVQGNLIGTDAAGNVGFGNGFSGVVIGSGSTGNLIGGITAAARNLISANGFNPIVGPGPGVLITDLGTSDNLVEGNFIGTDITGSQGLGNALAGVLILDGAAHNTIGGVTAGASNVIADSQGTQNGLFGDGIIIRDTANNLVQGNRVGTDVSGTLALPNHGNGVLLMSASENTIGGTIAGAGNLLSGNEGAGLRITSLILPPAGLNLDNPVAGGTLAPGTYYYVLTATTALGETTPSSELTAVVTAANPNVPLFWSAAPQATGYNLYRGTAPGKEDVLVTTINSGQTVSFDDVGDPTTPATPPIFNTAAGVDATMNVIQGNRIGTDAGGTAALPNTMGGVIIEAATSNQIGGAAAGAGNLISGNFLFLHDGSGVHIIGPHAPGNVIQGNLIGTDVGGTLALPNFGGISIDRADGTIIGGAQAGARNVIAGNSGPDTSGLFLLSSSNCQIQGNYIGVDATGEQPLPNSFAAILIQGGSEHLIGGTQPGAGNVLSANTISSGLVLNGSNDNTVQGNLIGTDAAGKVAFGNGFSGVVIGNGSSGNLIGGLTAGARNLISGNGFSPLVGPGPGVFITDFGTSANMVQGNFIGTDITGSQALGNALAGVLILDGAQNNTIGGVAAGAGNIIAGSMGTQSGLFGDGVIIRDTGNNLVQGNRIGTDASGTSALPNHGSGVLLMSATDNTIGGRVAGAGNQLSGNAGAGLRITSLILPPAGLGLNNPVAGGTLAPGTYFYVLTATTASGETTPSSELAAVVTAANPNVPLFWTPLPQATGYKLYRGTAPGKENELVTTVTSGATDSFVDFGGPTLPGTPPTTNTAAGVDATRNDVEGNLIGTNASGAAALPNSQGGVLIEASTNNTIGGSAAGTGNVISGNIGNGVLLTVGARLNTVAGNLIGTDASGTVALGNSGDGVQLVHSDNNLIGHSDPVSGVTYYNAANVNPTPNPGFTGIRNSDTAGNFLISGIAGSQGLLFDGTIAGVGVTRAVNVPLAGVTATAVYGPDNLDGPRIRLVGSYNTTGTGLADQFGFIYDGTATAADLSNPANYTTIDAGGDFNIVHSTMGGLAVGNSDSSPSQGQGSLLAHAFLYDIAQKKFLKDIIFPGSVSNTAYGIWYNGGSSYTICGGWSKVPTNNFDDPDRPIGQGFLVDYDSSTQAFTHWTSFDYPFGVNFFTHFEGISSVEKGVYTLNADSLQAGTTNPVQGSWVTVRRNTDETFGPAQWVNLNYTGIDPITQQPISNALTSSNSVYGNQVVGVVFAQGGAFAYQATVNTAFQLSNVISGNAGNGIALIGANDNQIAMNYIGTDVTGKLDRGNALNGILLTAASTGNTIGGEATGGNNPRANPPVFVRPPQGNLVSGNDGNGVLLTGLAATNQLSGNFIGTTASGNAALGNTLDGVAIDNAPGNELLGCTFQQDPFVFYNVLAGNHGNGLRITNSNVTTVQANFFGLGADNSTPVGNGLDGVLINGSSANTQFGGVIPLGNVVAGNSKNGVEIADTAGGGVFFNTFCGLPAFLKTAVPNAQDGFLITSTGGNNVLETNVISGNGVNGVHISGNATGVQLEDDIIGLTTNGGAALPNVANGVLIDGTAHDNLIGGQQISVIMQNAISANGDNGIAILGNASNTKINQSFIGTDLFGTTAFGNTGAGILVGGNAQNTTIGLIGASTPNVISGNHGGGIQLAGTSQGTQVLASLLGTDASGQKPLANLGNGISIVSSKNQIGGSAPGAGNVIAFNTQAGIGVSTGNSDGIHANSIFSNATAGIVLTANGNLNQPAPVLTGAFQSTPTNLRVNGTLTAATNTTYTVEIFSTPSGTPPGQGKQFVGSLSVTTNANGVVPFEFNSAQTASAGTTYTATATDPVNNTSAFSAAIPLGSNANTVFVANAYQLLLHRAPDPGAAGWVNALNLGVSPTLVVLGIEASTEYLTDQVAALYHHYLNRAPDPLGQQGWVSFLQHGGTFEQVSEAMVSSPEFFSEQGGTNQGYVQGLYQTVLGRAPGAAELNGYVSALNAGVSRLSVAIGFLTSKEYYTDLVQSDYNIYLGRPADPVGLASFVNAKQAGATDQLVLAQIFGSSEGYALWS